MSRPLFVGCSWLRAGGVAALLSLTGGAAWGQAEGAAPAGAVVVAPIGDRYAAGWLRRLLLGGDYRDLWATPVSIPVLDLASFGGGLTPVSRGGGQQTQSLRLRATDGRDFFFRSIDKDPTPNLPPELVGTIVAGLVQDQVSAAHPTAPLVVAPLLEAAGVLHGEPLLFILPDDARLGEFRADFAGLIGMLEPRVATGWGRATEIITGDELFRRIEHSPDDRVNVRALLRARLVDMLVGDWDRHRDQWSWARFGDETPRTWLPIPRDRDFAMVRYDGVFLALGRMSLPQLIAFGPGYSDVLGLTWNGRELDRHFLLELDWPGWESVVAELQPMITDAVIDASVRRLPPEHYAVSGPALAEALRRRRDALPAVAKRFYRMLAEQAEVYGTDADETAVLSAPDDQTVEISLFRASAEAGGREEPYLRRQFARHETKELRVFLGGGQDIAVVRGDRRLPVQVRVIGGAGPDGLLDSARVGGVEIYDEDEGTLVVGGAHLSRRRYVPPPKRLATEIPPRDWGHRWTTGMLLSGGPDIGVLLGLSRTLINYGFRKLPYASEHRFRAGVATGPGEYRVDYRGTFRRESSRRYAQVQVRASGIDVLRFHGFGNEQPATGSNRFYRVTQNQYSVALAMVAPVGSHGEISAGPTARYVTTDERESRFLATIDPYGADNFGAVGVRASLSLDSRSRPSPSLPGVGLAIGGNFYPGWWDVRRAYGELHGEVTSTVSVEAPLDPALFLRLGGKKVWGPYPYFDAAFIGGNSTVRLGRENRFAGDASSFATAELRLSLGRVFLGAPGDAGVFGLADAGRVYLKGEDSRKWHGAAGGGIWVSVLDRSNMISLAIARSEERTALYFQAGFGF